MPAAIPIPSNGMYEFPLIIYCLHEDSTLVFLTRSGTAVKDSLTACSGKSAANVFSLVLPPQPSRRALQPPDAAIHPKSRATRRPGLLSLGWALLSIGAVAFGGLGATLALLRRELVERRGWRPSNITDALAYTKPLPGSTVVQVVTFLGWRLGNWPGAIVAPVAFLLPALALMTVAAAAVLALPDAPWMRGALMGLQVAVVGLLAAALWHLARSEAGSALLLTVLLVAFAAGLFVNAALVVAAAGAIGVVIDRVTRDA
jgi:chromate transporter